MRQLDVFDRSKVLADRIVKFCNTIHGPILVNVMVFDFIEKHIVHLHEGIKHNNSTPPILIRYNVSLNIKQEPISTLFTDSEWLEMLSAAGIRQDDILGHQSCWELIRDYSHILGSPRAESESCDRCGRGSGVFRNMAIICEHCNYLMGGC